MSAMHEQMHGDTEGQEHDQDSVSGEDVNAVLVDHQQTGRNEEGDEGDARSRLPESR
jgi:hypothetical protein